MVKDILNECRLRLLQVFPERQLYLRSGGEVHYHVFSTRFQVAATGVLIAVTVWCMITMFNLLWGHNPLRAPAKEASLVEAKYKRLLEDSRAKETNARLMLSQQREEFDSTTRQFEEKHAAISMFLETQPADKRLVAEASSSLGGSRVQMAPTIRDVIPRQSRSNTIKKASLDNGYQTGMAFDNMDVTQNGILVAAESDTLDRIEKNRAILNSTQLGIDNILQQGGFGKGGIYIDLTDSKSDANLANGNFGSRISSIKARVAEAEALDNAMKSVPLGYPVDVEHYRTSPYGARRDPFTKRMAHHGGIDFASHRMAPILATADGIVISAGRNGAYGKMVEIDHGHGFTTRYGHLHKTNVKRGQKIKKGDTVGGMGSTGRSTATHLHYEVRFEGRAYDPDNFLKAGTYVYKN